MASDAWYFAYASNMKRAQMQSRAGEILEERLATLPDYEVAFNKKARGGTATANISQSPGKSVLGVLYRIRESAFSNLDRFEGAPQHYRRTELSVVDAAGNRIPAQVFIAARVEKQPLRPASHYLQTMVEGASEHGLPANYIEKIQAAAGA
jgi:gamma-glutamylcyclotransferase